MGLVLDPVGIPNRILIFSGHWAPFVVYAFEIGSFHCGNRIMLTLSSLGQPHFFLFGKEEDRSKGKTKIILHIDSGEVEG